MCILRTKRKIRNNLQSFQVEETVVRQKQACTLEITANTVHNNKNIDCNQAIRI